MTATFEPLFWPRVPIDWLALLIRSLGVKRAALLSDPRCFDRDGHGLTTVLELP